MICFRFLKATRLAIDLWPLWFLKEFLSFKENYKLNVSPFKLKFNYFANIKNLGEY